MIRLGSLVWLLFVGFPMLAAPFQNGSFEAGAFSPCNSFNLSGGGIITGWTIHVGNIDWEGAPFPACGWVAARTPSGASKASTFLAG